MRNPIAWLWELLHGTDSPAREAPIEPVAKLPLVTIDYKLYTVAPRHDVMVEPTVASNEDEFADLGKLPILIDSLL